MTGAAGVGKTRLGVEVLELAASEGYSVLRLTAVEAARSIPLGAFAPVLPPGTDDVPGQVHLLRVAREALGARAATEPLALLVDDAHLLDQASATLVSQLAASREAMLVVTLRAGEPVLDAIVALWKDHGCAYLELEPLSAPETGLLVEDLVGGEVEARTRHRLWKASSGLPLVVRELVLDGLAHGSFAAHDGVWSWLGPIEPRGRLLELVTARIGRLDADEKALLELIALGEPLRWSMLSGRERDVADALIGRGLVDRVGGGRELELRLAHPLFGEVVRSAIDQARLLALYRRLATALESQGSTRSDDVLRIAVWRLEAGDRVDHVLLIRAAALAERSLDAVLAERLARAAVDHDGGLMAERAVARALIGQGRFGEAEAILEPLAGKAKDEEERAWVALARARNLVVGLGRLGEAEAALVEVRRAVSDAGLRRELDLVRSWVLLYRDAARAAELSCALAEDTQADDAFRLRAAGIAAHALVQAGRPEDAHELVTRSAERGDVQLEAARILALMLTGRLGESQRAAAAAHARSLEEPAAEVTALMALANGRIALMQGRLEAASRWLRECSELLRDVDPGGFRPLALALAAQALAQAGETAAARELRDEAESERQHRLPAFESELFLASAWVAASAGGLTEARRAAALAVASAGEHGVRAAGMLAAYDLVRLGDPAGPSQTMALAQEMQGRLARACAEHAEAVLSREPARLERAASALAELGSLLWAAEAESAAANAYRLLGRDASARAAAGRAALLLERCGGARTPALVAAGAAAELTPREREIAAMAANGRSNREIAAGLVLSVRTVENHLQRVYRKLGARSRHELPALLGPDHSME